MRVAALILALLVLVLPTSAAAHTLTLRGAERVALRYAERVAVSVTPAPRSTSVRVCERRTRHVVDCTGRFAFAGGTVCERRIRVRFTSPVDRRVSRRFVGDLDCF